jgi:N-acetylglucosamine kinase-like BadF-type ATPase
MILIAESGSTKCDWVLLDEKGREIDRWKTIGFNPFFHSTDMISKVLSERQEFINWNERIEQVWFYGAGCSTPDMKKIVKDALDQVCTQSSNHVGHDLDAAAFALYQGEPFVACILGTGSNSCMFDGEKIHEKTPSLGYVLGDEGSAGFIGKSLVSDFLYQRMPEEMAMDFKKTYGLTKDQVIEAVYNKKHPNVFLAGFGPFAGKWREHAYVENIVKEGFNRFIDVHVMPFEEQQKIPVSFVGSVAKVYEDLLTECLNDKALEKGQVLAKPVNSLIQYHINNLKVLS